MSNNFTEIDDLLSIIIQIRKRYLASFTNPAKKNSSTIAHLYRLNRNLLPLAIGKILPSKEPFPFKKDRFQQVKKLSENHFKIRFCLNNQNDYLFRYAAHYYKKKFSLHDFYHWKMTKIFAVGAPLQKKGSLPHPTPLSSVRDLTPTPDNLQAYEYFKSFEKYHLK